MMNKQIDIAHGGKKYTLCFTRTVAARMERAGFDIHELYTKPVTMIPMLVSGAFVVNHSGAGKEEVDNVYEDIKGKAEFIKKLSEMYNATVDTLLDEPEGDEGNATWTAGW